MCWGLVGAKRRGVKGRDKRREGGILLTTKITITIVLTVIF